MLAVSMKKNNTFLIISFTLRYMSDKNLINHGIFYQKKNHSSKIIIQE